MTLREEGVGGSGSSVYSLEMLPKKSHLVVCSDCNGTWNMVYQWLICSIAVIANN